MVGIPAFVVFVFLLQGLLPETVGPLASMWSPARYYRNPAPYASHPSRNPLE